MSELGYDLGDVVVWKEGMKPTAFLYEGGVVEGINYADSIVQVSVDGNGVFPEIVEIWTGALTKKEQ